MIIGICNLFHSFKKKSDSCDKFEDIVYIDESEDKYAESTIYTQKDNEKEDKYAESTIYTQKYKKIIIKNGKKTFI